MILLIFSVSTVLKVLYNLSTVLFAGAHCIPYTTAM